MFFQRFKKKKTINLELGRKIFFQYHGSSFAIARECADEYKNCNVPKEYENLWVAEIITELRKAVDTSTGHAKFSNYLLLADLLSFDAAIDLTRTLLDTETNYFYKLLYVESLKRLNKEEKRKDVEEIIKSSKEFLLDNIVNVQNDMKNVESILIRNRDIDYIRVRITSL